jgi:hypothetical protein
VRRSDDDHRDRQKGHYVNIRSLTRGDGAVIGAAVLLLIASFMPFYSLDDCTQSGDSCSVSSWHLALLPTLPTVHLAALVAAALLFLARTSPSEERKPLGLTLRQWAVAIAVFVGWSAIWSVVAELWYNPSSSGADTLNDHTNLSIGAWLTLLFGLAVAVLAVLSERSPALRGPLLGAPKPAQPQGYAQPYAPGPGQPGGGYGYPGGGQPSFAGQPQQPGSPIGGLNPQQTPGGPIPAQGGGAGGAEFAPFWFAVPVARPLYAEDGSPTPIAELTPGTWYLAVDQRGAALVAQTQDGRRGVLQDTTGIQRG